MLKHRAALKPDQHAFTFISGAGDPPIDLSYGSLHRRAEILAEGLGALTSGAVGQSARVVLCLPAGFDFLAGFFACLYSNTIGVPVRSPHPKRSMSSVAGVVEDSAASIGLTSAELLPILRRDVPSVKWLTIAELESTGNQAAGNRAQDLLSSADDVAYLQYTSGSTSTPKGVMIQHRHVLANCLELARHWSIESQSIVFSWLPHFHDMGLVFGLMTPIYSGCPGVFMPPMAFAQKPIRWLEGISKFRATHSCAPNFAFETCSRLPETQLVDLDLSCWRVATNGAEPVRADTVERFSRHFSPFGFSADALCPGYGLAENTLMVTSCVPGRSPVIRTVDAEALKDRRFEPRAEGEGRSATRLTSSGPVAGMDTTILMVDPETCQALESEQIGEIWLAGPSVTGGYWDRPEATAEKFTGRLNGSEQGPFLRTGDLGVTSDGELFVLGRIDDLIVVRGANHHPEDLELTLESCHPALEPNGGAVFAVQRLHDPRLVITHEVRRSAVRRLDADAVIRSMVAAISENHELEVAAVMLLRPRSLPRTHSGKKQRHACRVGFRDGSLKALKTWVAPKLQHLLQVGSEVDPEVNLDPEVNQLDLRIGIADSSDEQIAESMEHERRSPAMAIHEPLIARRQQSSTHSDEAHSDEAHSDEAHSDEAHSDATHSDATDLIHWLRDYAALRLNSSLMDERRSMPPYVALDLGNRGVLSMVAPKAYGGLDLDHGGLARVLEQLAAIDLTLASFVSVNNALGIRPILCYGTPQKKKQILPVLGSGRELAAFAMTEPGAGSNVRAIAAQGKTDPDGSWRLWGTKIWSGSAAWAGFINTFVQLKDASGAPRGVTGFVLRQGRPGLRMGPEALTMGLRAMVQNKVFLEGVRVDEDDLLGEPGQGMDVAMDTMEFGRFCLSALSLGVLKRCLQLMVRHADRRTIATGKLIANPVTLTRISDLTAAAGAVESLIRSVAERLDAGLTVPPELYCVCKTTGPEFAWRSVDHLVQQMAGRGFIESNLAPQILRDTRILRIFEGPTEPMNAFIGSRLVHQPDELCGFLADELGQPGVADELRDATERIAHRCQSASSPFTDSSSAKSWTYTLVGEVACYAVLLAVVRSRPDADSPALRRVEPWLRGRFDRRLAKALTATPAEDVLLDAVQAADLVGGYDADIGNLEQSLMGEDRRLDELIARSPDGAAVDLAEPTAFEPTGQWANADHEISGPAQELIGWLKDWLITELDLLPASVETDSRFGEFGIDSVTALKLANAMEQRTGLQLPSTLIWDYPTLRELGVAVGARLGADREPASTRPESIHRPEAVESAKNPIAGSEPAIDDLSLLAQVDDLPEDQLEALLSRLAAEEQAQ